MIALFSFWLAILLRYEISNFNFLNNNDVWYFFLINQSIFIASFVGNGLYLGVWRFSSTHDLIRVIRASFIGTVISILTIFFILRLEGIPRSIFIMQFFILVVGLGGGRFLYRFLKDQTNAKKFMGGHDSEVQHVVIIGAGRAGEKLIRDINTNPSLKLRILGIFDDDPYKKNALIHNVKVIGKIEQIKNLVTTTKVDKIFIAIPSATNQQVKSILSHCKNIEAEVQILPKMTQLMSTEIGISLLRNVKIEDLLGREQVKLDKTAIHNMLDNKTLLITGAGGSIGSEICRQIASFNPKKIILVDYCELFMYEIEKEFRTLFPNTDIAVRISDVRYKNHLSDIFFEYDPDIVFHAAAYKHVPLMEQNPKEAIRTNIIGTQNVAELSLEYGVQKFVMVSTDKAVNPTNIMGSSKRIAEMVITNISLRSKTTKFTSVRFGNVLGSNGSVIPHFRKLIDERKDITITHPDMTRFFMSIPEASQLVLQAGALSDGGEIFVLDMGSPIKIVDLAKQMIKLANLEIGKDINIVFTGLRPGEKLYEELFSDQEALKKTQYEKINIAKHRILPNSFERDLQELIQYEHSDKITILNLMRKLVPELKHELLDKKCEENTNLS